MKIGFTTVAVLTKILTKMSEIQHLLSCTPTPTYLTTDIHLVSEYDRCLLRSPHSELESA